MTPRRRAPLSHVLLFGGVAAGPPARAVRGGSTREPLPMIGLRAGETYAMSEPVADPTEQLRRRRHAHHLEGAFSSLILAWQAHFDSEPETPAVRKEIVMAMGVLGSGKSPRDAARIAALPAVLLDAHQLEALGLEIEAFHAEASAAVAPAQGEG